MEKELIIEQMRKPKVGSTTKLKLNNYRVELGQVVKGGTSVYMSIGGYVFDNAQISLYKQFSHLNERLSHLVSKSSSELFKTLNKRMPFLLTHDNTVNDTKNRWSYFNLEVTLYFTQGVTIDDIKDDLMLIGYCILDYLEDEFVLDVRPHK